MTAEAQRFSCSVAGSVAHGRRRLRLLLGGLVLLMIGVAIAAFVSGRLGAGLIALVAGIGPLFALGLVGETDIEGLELAGGMLTIHLSSGRERLPLAGGTVRPLTPDEIAHIERLATTAGIVAGTGGFDSHLLGEIDLYATHLDHSVLVWTEERAVVVTPDDPDRFVTVATAFS